LNKRKLLAKIQNSSKNVRYGDFAALIEAFGFMYERTEGSHRMYKHKDVAKIVNAQNEKGQAKPYQIKQFFALVKKYDIELEGEDNE